MVREETSLNKTTYEGTYRDEVVKKSLNFDEIPGNKE